MRSKNFLACCVGLGAFLLAATGCGGGGSTVSGEVTFNGKPVSKGYINFIPVDGKGKSVGGEITGGRYSVRDVTAGKNKVEVTEYTGAAPDSMDASLKDAKKNAPTADTLTANSEGNGQTHDIPSGGTTLNLTLKTASTSEGKVK